MAISKIITSSLTDDAVTSAKIGTDQVGADALSSSAISGAVDIPANSVGQSELVEDYTAQSVPHIIPGVLQPAVAGKDLSGTALGGSYVYGTAHTDGHKYYYTDIKGSKPIKDPRIGAHFGSQRHRISSIQLLEQETATHGKDVFSIDGRDWLRVVGGTISANDARGSHIVFKNGSNAPDGDFLEITGYFNKLNYLAFNEAGRMGLNYQVNGGSATQTNDTQFTAVTSPLDGRYVNPMAVHTINIGTITGPGIYTVKLVPNTTTAAAHHQVSGIELIAQDTTSTANRSKIQIPSQNVVSFGKKFNVSGTPHYDPFTTMSYGGSGTTLSNLQSLIDTDTSLGMDAWKAGTSNYHRPWNGGRVIKWVDSSGTIKTSVNMMPPNAQNIGTTASNAVSDAHVSAGTNDDTINFNTSAVDNTQSEVAKSFYYREFGNGAANEGANTSGTKQDFSMLNFKDSVAYVMDDGLTSMNGFDVTGEAVRLEIGDSNNESLYLTFIGTGISYKGGHTGDPGPFSVAKNLPYGTHILRISRLTSSSDTGQLFIDGVNIWDQPSNRYGMRYPFEFSIYQPKKPPIPEEAVILGDYMLMADFVPLSGTGSQANISKGVRLNSASRDLFYTESDDHSFVINAAETDAVTGMNVYLNGVADSATSAKIRLPSFATNYVVRGYRMEERARLFIGDTDKDAASYRDDATNRGSYAYITNNSGNSATISSNETLGINNFGLNAENNKDPYIGAFEIATPIHTSSHYQSFETPYLYELIGGDRNMEQTNLVVSPDGKTWDEVTRDTSYIGSITLQTELDGQDIYGNQVVVFDEWRGTGPNANHDAGGSSERNLMNKNFAIAYDRMICLVSGEYEIVVWSFQNDALSGSDWGGLMINGEEYNSLYNYDANSNTTPNISALYLSRGDTVQYKGSLAAHGKGTFYIRKI